MSSGGAGQAPDLAVGDERFVEIGPIAHGGHFIAHSDGRTLFVRHAMTGETVRVRVTDVNRKMVRADAIEVIHAAPERVAAPCPWAHADGCGGCDFQHIEVPAQRRLKQEVLTDALRRFGRLDDEQLGGLDLTVNELPGHPDGLGWRTRMTWATDEGGRTGLRRYRRHDVIAVDRCLIAAEGVDVPGDAPDGKVTHEVRDRSWRMDRGDFWQVHDALPEALVNAVLEFGEPRPGESWWDLYAGAGLFAAFLGEAVGEEGAVDSIEEAAPAVKAARRALHDLPQVDLYEGDVRTWLATAAGRPDGVVLDPPRAGAGEAVLSAVCERAPDRLVYVACDPVALGRDVALLAVNGYRLDRVRAFDAFPMTHHLETVALFVVSDS
jgi:tRNA/tmRNA/rRNA uracil-C5-methylase (TrmA/RlmC/RlmD family)